jgi:hypothetical protein
MRKEDLTVQKGLEYAPVTKVRAAGLQISMMIVTNTKKNFERRKDSGKLLQRVFKSKI